MKTPHEDLQVYWQPGCTSCLRTKEFLTRHGVEFRSRNVLEDEGAYSDLARLGLRQVPIVTRGDEWVDGQVLTEVARIAGIELGESAILPVEELQRRLDVILLAAQRFLVQLPERELESQLPDRPRSYADLVYHIFNIADAFLEHEDGVPLVFDSYNRVPQGHARSKAGLSRYASDVRSRLHAWFDGPGRSRDWSARADVYYGRQSMHEFLERTTWHAGQHVRQLQWVLERLDIPPHDAPPKETWDGLPMPQQVWEGA